MCAQVRARVRGKGGACVRERANAKASLLLLHGTQRLVQELKLVDPLLRLPRVAMSHYCHTTPRHGTLSNPSPPISGGLSTYVPGGLSHHAPKGSGRSGSLECPHTCLASSSSNLRVSPASAGFAESVLYSVSTRIQRPTNGQQTYTHTYFRRSDWKGGVRRHGHVAELKGCTTELLRHLGLEG